MSESPAALLGRFASGVFGLLALSAMIWWLGPLIELGSQSPLDPPLWRAALIAVLWCAWCGRFALGAWARRRTNAVLVRALAGDDSSGASQARQMVHRFDAALRKLRAAKGGGWGADARLLFELPWYIFVGAPGSGKTTALANAGLRFLLQDAGGGAALHGVGGTQHFEWWFTADAVLIDTAGRYAVPSADQDSDATPWDRFMVLLKRTRPRQPLNGVLLLVDAQDLLEPDQAQRLARAQSLRKRLGELRRTLDVRMPVYLVITKADLISGFIESFGSLGKDERNQVWGLTFPPTVSGAGALATEFDDRYAELLAGLSAGLVERMEAERDLQRRMAIFAFPDELAALAPALRDFVAHLGAGGDAEGSTPWLRGVYFTSGTQSGSPIDRAMGALGRALGFDGSTSARTPGLGKSYFLHRLLTELVFAEQSIGIHDPGAEVRWRRNRRVLFTAMAMLALALCAGWAVSWSSNLDHAAQIAARVPALQVELDALARSDSIDLAALAAPLTRLREAARLQGKDAAAPPLLQTLGLYQGEKLDAAAQSAYRGRLQQLLAPRVARRVEERLRSAVAAPSPDLAAALRHYLALHDPARFDAPALHAWIAADLKPAPGELSEQQRGELLQHLGALLSQGPLRAARPRDEALVSAATQKLATLQPDGKHP